jgi:hypothetical protein
MPNLDGSQKVHHTLGRTLKLWLFGAGWSLLRDEAMDNAIIESDCLSLVQRLHYSLMERSSVEIVAVGMKHLVRGFTSGSLRHVKRVLNGGTPFS